MHMLYLNDMLRDLCVIDGFGFICNDMIWTKYLWKDSIHLQDLRTSILKRNFILLFYFVVLICKLLFI